MGYEYQLIQSVPQFLAAVHTLNSTDPDSTRDRMNHTTRSQSTENLWSLHTSNSSSSSSINSSSSSSINNTGNTIVGNSVHKVCVEGLILDGLTHPLSLSVLSIAMGVSPSTHMSSRDTSKTPIIPRRLLVSATPVLPTTVAGAGFTGSLIKPVYPQALWNVLLGQVQGVEHNLTNPRGFFEDSKNIPHETQIKGKILVVDDNALNRVVATKILERYGYQVYKLRDRCPL
jgi:hypothetical protein